MVSSNWLSELWTNKEWLEELWGNFVSSGCLACCTEGVWAYDFIHRRGFGFILSLLEII